MHRIKNAQSDEHTSSEKASTDEHEYMLLQSTWCAQISASSYTCVRLNQSCDIINFAQQWLG